MLNDDGLAGRDRHVSRVTEGLKVELELDTSEVRSDAILADGERARRELVVENGAELEDLDRLGARVRHSGGDLDVLDGVNLRGRCGVRC